MVLASKLASPDRVLDPRRRWSDPAVYDARAEMLSGIFAEILTKFENGVSEGVRVAGLLVRTLVRRAG